MPKKYHIPVKAAPPRFQPIGKYATIEFREDCAGSCAECVKKRCIYGVFKDNFLHMSTMAQPDFLYICQSCFRCVQECTRGIFSRVVNPEYRALGDDYWRADIIHQTWNQSNAGRIPVSGAGYRGPFVGEGFDSMWTDMSEIVRPTRDGIHGREYINTSIELSRRPLRLEFNPDMSLATDLPPILETQLPILLQQPTFGVLSREVLVSMVKAAHTLESLMFIQAQDYGDDLAPYAKSLVPCLTRDNYEAYADLVQGSRMVELAYEPGVQDAFAGLRSLQPQLCISVGIPVNSQSASRALELAHTDVDTLHFYATDRGGEQDTENPRHLKDMIREIHTTLVNNSIRTKLNMVFSGGIAMAEDVAKAIICGADGVAVDYPLLVALECRLCYRCRDGKSCPVKLEAVDSEWGSQRIVNLLGAWHSQLLEVAGAMGIREVRRMRGEVGRALWFDDMEREIFGPIFGERKVQGTGVR